jgi:hypothetical protein
MTHKGRLCVSLAHPRDKNAHPTDFSLNDIEGTTNKGSTATVLRLPRSLLSLKDIRTLCKSRPFQKETGHPLRNPWYQNRCPVMAEMEGFEYILVLLRSSPQQADVHRTSAFDRFKSLISFSPIKKPPHGVVFLLAKMR